jgi:hypothetical protein
LEDFSRHRHAPSSDAVAVCKAENGNDPFYPKLPDGGAARTIKTSDKLKVVFAFGGSLFT